MRTLACFIVSVGIGLNCVRAQRHEEGNLGEVDTIWPGIRLQVLKVERIPANRLLAVVRLVATRQAPASGTLIGTKVAVPANIPKEEVFSGRYAPRAFSLLSSVMIHEQTQRKYPALPPADSAGRNYIPGEVLGTLFPGEAEVLTVQFAAPSEMVSAGTDAPKQTASFLLSNAKEPIGKVPIPPPEAVDESAVQGR
jgi:hypothetical protein